MIRGARIAETPRLLVALDFDGTLAPIVPQPERAAPLPEAVLALKRLAALRDTDLAIISGRDVADLKSRLGTSTSGLWLSGSHGRVILGPDEPLQEVPSDPRLAVIQEVPLLPGVRRENKDYSVSFHWRGRSQGVPLGWLEGIRRRAQEDGLVVMDGRQVLEVMIPGGGGKDAALRRIFERTGASAVLYAGDDTTDREAILLAADRGQGIFLSSGESIWNPPPSVLVLDGPHSLVGWLNHLAQRRAEWMESHSVGGRGESVAT